MATELILKQWRKDFPGKMLEIRAMKKRLLMIKFKNNNRKKHLKV